MTVHWLGSDPCHDARSVGAKAANLSQLAAEFRVPPGFAIPGLAATTIDLGSELAEMVRRAYRTLADDGGDPAPRVAVRSSALDEDGAGASFAGQHATFLNVTGEDAVLDAVVRCCASAASDVALAYRAVQRLSSDDIRIAVLVQRLVRADVAAVAFSANPLTGARHEVMVNASWGLGESIVSGFVTPDCFIVDTGTFAVTSSGIEEKAVMTVMTEDGTREAPVPRIMRRTPSLSDEQAIEIARLAHDLEVRMGWPVDIECAIAGGVLYLLQCRPITTLGTVR